MKELANFFLWPFRIIFLLPEILIVLLIIGLAYLPYPFAYFVVADIIFGLMIYAYWERLIQIINRVSDALSKWRGKRKWLNKKSCK